MLTKGSTSYTYDNSMNRLSKVGSSDDYSYDLNGNLVNGESGSTTWTYGYDVFNHLTSVKRNGTVQRLYSYDADGRRVRSHGGASGNMRYVYSGLKVLFEAPDAGGTATLRFYAGSLQVAEKTGSMVEYLHQDHLGSTRLKTNSTGGSIYSSNYQPYGVSSGESGSEEFRYTGKPEDDASGLYYYGARYYLPEIGRFITADVKLGSLTEPQTLNRYVYCINNPNKYYDPNGKWIETALDITSLGYDLYELYNDPSLYNIAMVVWDVIGLVPGVPGSWALKLVNKIDDIGDVSKVVSRFAKMVNTLGDIKFTTRHEAHTIAKGFGTDFASYRSFAKDKLAILIERFKAKDPTVKFYYNQQHKSWNIVENGDDLIGFDAWDVKTWHYLDDPDWLKNNLDSGNLIEFPDLPFDVIP